MKKRLLNMFLIIMFLLLIPIITNAEQIMNNQFDLNTLTNKNIGKEMYSLSTTSVKTSTKITINTKLNYNSICSNDGIKSAVKVIGIIIQIVRWIVPLIIIVLGMMDFGKAIIANDEKGIGKSVSSLIRRFIAGIVVFFIPTIVLAILEGIEISKGLTDETNTQFGACTKCIFAPFDTTKCPD